MLVKVIWAKCLCEGFVKWNNRAHSKKQCCHFHSYSLCPYNFLLWQCLKYLSLCLKISWLWWLCTTRTTTFSSLSRNVPGIFFTQNLSLISQIKFYFVQQWKAKPTEEVHLNSKHHLISTMILFLYINYFHDSVNLLVYFDKNIFHFSFNFFHFW